MLRRFALFSVLSACLGAVACTSVHSDMTINGQRFGPDQCKNDQDEEMFGVDLMQEDGTVLRIVHNVDDSIDVVVIDGIHRPVAMTNCAIVHLDRSNNDKYGHYTLSGEATVNCDGAEYQVHGTTNFDDCGHDF